MPLAFIVGIAAPQPWPTTFKVVSDVIRGWTVTIPAGNTWARTAQAMPQFVAWQPSYNFCVTPDLNEQGYPCRSMNAKTTTVAPLDPTTVQISAVKINGDNGTGTAAVQRGTALGVEVLLNAVPPVASISIRIPALHHYNNVIYARNVPYAIDTPFVDRQLGFGGKKGAGVVTADLNGKAVTRSIQILPLKQVDRTCFFDAGPTAGYWSATFDFCANELQPGTVIGGQRANGFIRRGFASAEPVYVELSSSDPSIAAVSSSAGTIPNQQRGLTFTVTTVPTGGTPKNVTIKVVEGGTYEYQMPLTIR
jgi:hypothetical protein